MYLLLEKVNFHCHVSLLEDTFFLGTRQLPARWESVSFSSSVRRNHWCHWLLTRWLSGGKKHPNYALFLPRETSWAASRISRRRARIDHAPDITGAKKGRKHRGCEAEKDSSVGCKNKKTFTFNPISMWRGFQGSMKKMLESISSVQYVAWLDMPFAGMFFVVWGVDHVTITAASELKKTWFRHRLGEPLTLWQWKVKVSICSFIKLNRFFILDQSQKTNGQRRQFHPQSWRGRKFRDQARGHRISKEDGTNYHVLVLKNYVPTILFHKIVFFRFSIFRSSGLSSVQRPFRRDKPNNDSPARPILYSDLASEESFAVYTWCWTKALWWGERWWFIQNTSRPWNIPNPYHPCVNIYLHLVDLYGTCT